MLLIMLRNFCGDCCIHHINWGFRLPNILVPRKKLFEQIAFFSKCRSQPIMTFHEMPSWYSELSVYGRSRCRSSDVPQKTHRFLSSIGGKSRKINITWKGVIVFFGVSGILLVVLQYSRKQKELEIARERSKELGKAKLGGDWELVNASSQRVTNRDFFGQWVLLYFGFSHCPDICPEEMEKLVKVVNTIDDIKHFPNLSPIFVTVDPERDTPSVVGEYCKEYSPKIVGLTGTQEQVNTASRAYRVYYSSGPKDEDDDYIVDHTIIMYLIGPDGLFVDYYGQNRTHAEISSSVAIHMKKFEALK